MLRTLCLTTAAVMLIGGCATSTQIKSQDNISSKDQASIKAPMKVLMEIAPDVYSFKPGDGYVSMFVVTSEGVAVFETVSSDHSKKMIEAVRTVTDKPIVYGFHSHNHWDHASGGQVIKDAGGKTVMHKRAAEWLAAHPGQDTATPDVVWNGDQRIFKLGDITVELNYLGLNHGLGMTVFRIPEKQVAYMADIVSPNRMLFNIVPDFNIGEWERSLGEIMTLDFDKAVCSHNEFPDDRAFVCSKVNVQEHMDFMGDLRMAIFAEFKKGTPADDIPSVVKLPQYAHWEHYEEWLPLNTQRMLLDLWMGPYPWIPGGR